MARILNGAADLFAERGYEVTTMEAIAERAQTSIGSVYQFFGRKADVFVALADRAIESVRGAFLAEIESGLLTKPWTEQVDRLVDMYGHLDATSPDLRAMNANLHLYGMYEEADQALLVELSHLCARALFPEAGHLSLEDRVRAARTAIELGAAVFLFRSRAPPSEFESRLAEGKRALKAYLGSYLMDSDHR